MNDCTRCWRAATGFVLYRTKQLARIRKLECLGEDTGPSQELLDTFRWSLEIAEMRRA
jgi:hypothetical protein